MASKRAQRRRGCEKKLQYRNELEARNAVKAFKLKVADGNSLGYYECPFGNHWHIGNRPRNKQKSLISLSKRGE